MTREEKGSKKQIGKGEKGCRMMEEGALSKIHYKHIWKCHNEPLL
jgi:hypothetical protein